MFNQFAVQQSWVFLIPRTLLELAGVPITQPRDVDMTHQAGVHTQISAWGTPKDKDPMDGGKG